MYVIDPNDVTRRTWYRNSGTHRGVDIEVLHVNRRSLKPSIRDDLLILLKPRLGLMFDGENNNTNNIPENAADIISPNLQESMRSNNQRVAIINHQRHK